MNRFPESKLLLNCTSVSSNLNLKMRWLAAASIPERCRIILYCGAAITTKQLREIYTLEQASIIAFGMGFARNTGPYPVEFGSAPLVMVMVGPMVESASDRT